LLPIESALSIPDPTVSSEPDAGQANKAHPAIFPVGIKLAACRRVALIVEPALESFWTDPRILARPPFESGHQKIIAHKFDPI
jgi:hypothetical protein